MTHTLLKTALAILAVIGIAGCTSKPFSAPKLRTAWDLLQEDDFWTFVGADAFADGGSATLSFIGRDGEIIHLWADGSRGSDKRRIFFLKRTYDDPNAVEVREGSALEQRVLALLASSNSRHVTCKALDQVPEMCAALLRDRTLKPAYGWPGMPTGPLPPPGEDSVVK